LHDDPSAWAAAGAAGRSFVAAEYADAQRFAAKLLQVIDNLDRPLLDVMRMKGLIRGEAFGYEAWSKRLGDVLSWNAPSQKREAVAPRLCIVPQASRRIVACGACIVPVPVRVLNEGTGLAAATGPARVTIHHDFTTPAGQPSAATAPPVPLPQHLPPKTQQIVVVPVDLPSHYGSYEVRFWAERAGERISMGDACMELVVTADTAGIDAQSAEPFLIEAQKSLAAALAQRTLPDGYHDVTTGPLASLKRRIKAKLLNNFRRSYVDVLSHQQSEFNAAVLAALSQLADACAAIGQTPAAVPNELNQLPDLLRKSLRRQRRLERRLRALEERLGALEV
jgi:hypothetical protein